jgi:small multidrug resistance pump
MPWLALTGAIALEIIATLSMKASHGFTKKIWIIPVLFGYSGAFVLLAVVLAQGVSVGVTYAIWAASGVALVAIFGRILFREPLTWSMAAGIALIIGGILMIELGADALQ